MIHTRHLGWSWKVHPPVIDFSQKTKLSNLKYVSAEGQDVPFTPNSPKGDFPKEEPKIQSICYEIKLFHIICTLHKIETGPIFLSGLAIG